MLSKSQARAFFLIGTGICTATFVGLTVDTLRRIPAQTNAAGLSEQVVRGKVLWDQNNCMGCHTLLGEGAYYAPELTRVYERRGAAWMQIFLKDPQAMFPGKRKMVQYHFKDDQIAEVIAFLKWVGEIDTNGFPRKPDLIAPTASSANATASVGSATGSSAATPPALFTTVCQACHSLAGTGGKVGPALDGVANRYTEERMDLWLKNPQAVKPGTAMPNLGLSDKDRTELTGWLMTLK